MENENLNEVTTNSFIENSFTLEEDKVNLEVNRLSANCINSTNNKFSLDSEGNLVVNSITTRTNATAFDVDLMYPVGSIYMNMSDINPTLFFGGVWEQISGKFLLSSSDTYEAGSTGGEEKHILTLEELPSHRHNYGDYYRVAAGSNFEVVGYNGVTKYPKEGTCAAGGSKSHNNMPPYLVVYMWKRVA